MDCSFEPDLTLDEWVGNLFNSLGDERFPLSASIELTERCNLSCIHCYIKRAPNDSSAQARELSASEWKELIDQITDSGCLYLLISGGEPLLQKEFKEVFTYARKKGLIVTLFSNATLLTAEMADFLADYGLHSIEVSLYGATQETYEKVTGIPGSFDRCLRGINLCLERGIDTNLKTVLLSWNIHELEAIKELAAKLGVKYRYDCQLWPRIDGSTEVLSLQLTQDEVLNLDFQDKERIEGWRKVERDLRNVFLREDKVFFCGAGFRSFHIDSSGNLMACMMTRKPSYNLLELPFNIAWEELGKIRDLKRQRKTECETCSVNGLCLQCPGWSLQYHGDYETPVSFVCDLGKKRAHLMNENRL